MLITLTRTTTFLVLFYAGVQLVQAAPLWYNIQPLPQANILFDIECSSSECIAVGAGGASVNIRPNASMVTGEPYSDAILYRVMRDANEFLAFQIGTPTDPYARLLKSNNGYRWAATGNKLVRGNSIVVPTRMIKAGNQYVAVGFDFADIPFVARSPDTITWTYTVPPITGTTSKIYDVASNPSGQTLVAVGNFGGTTSHAYVSTDYGINWSYQATPVGMLALRSVVWDTKNNQFVAVGYDGGIITSPNGITWTDHSIAGSTLIFTAVAEHQGLLVAVGSGGAMYSNDAGVTWSYGLNSGSSYMYALAWTGSLMLAVGEEGDIRASYDGFLWFEWDYVGANPPRYNDVAVNDLYTVVAVGSQGRLDYSLDSGSIWAKGPSTALANQTYRAVEWVKDISGVGAGSFVAVGSNIAQTSSTGGPFNWTSSVTPPAGVVSDLAFNNPAAGSAKLVAVGSNSSYTSTNGATWVSHIGAFPPPDAVNGVAGMTKSPYTFVAVGSGNKIYSSADAGVTWTARTSPITLLAGESVTFNDVFWSTKYGGGFFFAVGTKSVVGGGVEGVLVWSSTGSVWGNGSNSVAVRQNKQFLAINGSSTDIFITGQTDNPFSPAGIIIENNTLNFSAWSQVPLPATPSLNAVVPINVGGAIAVGNTSVIISKLDDTTPPSQIIAPADLTLEAVNANPIPLSDVRIQSWLALFYAKDNRDITILDITNDAPSIFAPNTITPIHFTAKDKAGNVTPVGLQRNIIIQDMQPPVVTPPANISVPSQVGVLGATNTTPAIVSFLNGATAIDNVDGTITTISNDAPALFPIGTTLVTFSATDSGVPANTGTATATVTVWDAQAPIIKLPPTPHKIIAATGPNPLPASDPYVQQYLNAVTATDNLDAGLLDVYSDALTFPVGTQVFIDFYASDKQGNIAHNPLNSASITVQDLTAPVVTTPADISVLATSALGTDISNALIQRFLNEPTATDNVDGSIAVYNDAPSVFPLGVTKVTFFADDASGNRSTVTAAVEVTSGTGGTPDAASCLTDLWSPKTSGVWFSLVLLVIGARRFKRKQN